MFTFDYYHIWQLILYTLCLFPPPSTLQECAQLTDVSLQAIGQSCPNLKYLDVSLCGGMSNEAADKMEQQLPALTTVHKVGLMAYNTRASLETAQRPPTPPPPPRRFRCSLLCWNVDFWHVMYLMFGRYPLFKIKLYLCDGKIYYIFLLGEGSVHIYICV